ncbi:MAG: multidrug efflux SMR transporter [Candidatus Methylopumilus sp.]|jgi:small multidrug resistance pump
MSPILVAWLLLAASILSEVVGTVALKHSNGFANLLPTTCAAASFLIAIWLMSLSLKHIEMGITYAVWAGSATAILAMVGIALYGESLSVFKMVGMVMVVGGVIVLNLDTH